MSDEPRGPGRPTKYDPSMVPLVERMCELGLTNAEICKVLDIHIDTFIEWKKIYPAFSEANAKAKDDPNARVEKSLFLRALGGFTIKETIKDADGVVIRTVEKEIPPDTSAATKWLFNRDPKRWRDKVEIEHSGSVDMTTLSQEEFDRRAREILEAFQKTND